MALRQEVVMMSAQQYTVVDENTGELKEGTSVRLVYSDSLKPCNEDGLKGYKVAKASAAFKDFFEFIEVPGVYECDLTLKIDKDGKTNATASNFKFMKSLFPAPAPAGK